MNIQKTYQTDEIVFSLTVTIIGTIILCLITGAWMGWETVALIIFYLGAILGLIQAILLAIAKYINKRDKIERNRKYENFINSNSVNRSHVELKLYEVNNPRDFPITALGLISESNTRLKEFGTIINRDIETKIVKRRNTNIIDSSIEDMDISIGNKTLSQNNFLDFFFGRQVKNEDNKHFENMISSNFVVQDINSESSFFFSIVDYKISNIKKITTGNRNHNINALDQTDEILFDIILTPNSIDNLRAKYIKYIDYSTAIEWYKKWRTLLFIYDFFVKGKTEFNSNEDYFSFEEKVLTRNILRHLTIKIEEDKTILSKENKNEILSNINSIEQDLNIKSKSKIRVDLRKLRERLIWLGKDFIWEVIKEIAMQGLPFLN